MSEHGGRSGAAGSPDGGRAVPYVCAFCGEEDLRPVEGGRWHCRSCLRVFSVAFHGIEPPAFSTPAAPVTSGAAGADVVSHQVPASGRQT